MPFRGRVYVQEKPLEFCELKRSKLKTIKKNRNSKQILHLLLAKLACNLIATMCKPVDGASLSTLSKLIISGQLLQTTVL